jgi:hypothetical protein
VRLYGGALASEPELGVLNGANVAAIGSAAAGWEVVQFETASLTGEGTWELSGLLRGQAGTADIAEAGHAEGAAFVLLDGAVPLLALSEAESGLALTARCGPAGIAYDPDLFTDVTLGSSRRGLICLRPVHLSAARNAESGDVTLRWIRQTRMGGDAWEPVEVPLGEASEAYRVSIFDGATLKRTIDAGTAVAAYAAAEQEADFGELPDVLSVAVSQVSATEGAGMAVRQTISL